MQARFYPSSTDRTAPTRSDRLRAALEYAARGWPVFPCRPGGKEPLTPRGHLDATTDPRRITGWLNRWPDANIGVPTGERSGLLAVDVDQPAGLDELERERGKLPATRTHGTGSGGMHHLYRYPAGSGIRNSAGKLAPGLDVRGEGGYIIVPPSRTTRPYELLDDLPPAEPPPALLEALRRPERARSGNARARTAPVLASLALGAGPIPEGTRDDALARIAGRLHDGTRDLDALAAGLLEVNRARCVPPLPDGQVEKIARSIHARTPCRPGRRATSETLEALERVEARLWRREWSGMGELSARDVYVALVKAGREHGTLIPAGVRVSISVRALALAAAVSKPTAIKAVRRLVAAGLVRRDYGGRSGTAAGALVLLTGEAPRANVDHSPTGLRSGPSGKGLRAPLSAPRLRWSAPLIERVGDEVFRSTIRRLGKGCGAVIDALERAGGSATVGELADALHKSRPRDLRRRTVARLEAAGVVECSGETVSLARDWLDALNLEREAAGEIDAHRRDMARYAREREAYASRDTIRPEPVPERPAGSVEELERIEAADPELVEALAAYLERSPACWEEPPSWLAVALWADDLVEGKPSPAAVEVALSELPGRRAA